MRDELAAKIFINLSLDDFDSFEDAADYAVEAADALVDRLSNQPKPASTRFSEPDESEAPKKSKGFLGF